MKKALSLTVLLAVLSSVSHLYLAKRAYQLEAGTASESSICHIGENVNCDSALLSPYAKIFDISLSNFGLSFNLILSALLIWFLFFGSSPYWKNISFYLAGVIAFSSLAMAAISIIDHLFCPICWTLYLLSFAILGLLFWLFKTDLEKPIPFILKNIKQKNAYILSGLLLFLSFFTHALFVSQFDLKDQKEFLEAQFQDWQYAEKIEIKPEALITKGSSKSNMHIVEFADFLCPACKRIQPALKKFLSHYPDVTFEFYAYPLDGVCNPSINIKKTGLSCELSKALVCGNEQEKGWELHDFIFEKQTQFIKAQEDEKKIKNLLEKMLLETHINKKDFELCMDNPDTLEQIKKSALAGKKADIHGTPSFFINGKAIPYSPQLLILKTLYEHLY